MNQDVETIAATSIRRRRARAIAVGILHFTVMVLAVMSVIPFAWLICASFKDQGDMFTSTFLPWGNLERLTFANIRSLFTEESFATWLLNSLFMSCTHTSLTVTLSSLGGFALAKYRFRGKTPLMFIMMGTMLIPGQVLLPSSYQFMYQIGWLDSYAALIIPGAVSVFGMLLFRQAMQGIPDDLLHAGRIDGCSEFRLWWDVALPVVRPMTGAFTLLSFTASWNSFIWPQIILQNEAKYTLPIGLSNMMGLPAYQTQYGILMAGTMLSIAPVMILFFVLQKEFIAGLTSGAVKG